MHCIPIVASRDDASRGLRVVLGAPGRDRFVQELRFKLHLILQYFANTLDESEHFHGQAHVQVLMMPVSNELGIKWEDSPSHGFDQNHPKGHNR